MIWNLLPSLLRHSSISRLADGGVYITDRRALPFVEREVFCPDAEAVAKAIREMVTQGGGPLEAALNALLLTYRTAPGRLDEAVDRLSASRPTNTTMRRELEAAMERFRNGEDMEWIVASVFERYDGIPDILCMKDKKSPSPCYYRIPNRRFLRHYSIAYKDDKSFTPLEHALTLVFKNRIAEFRKSHIVLGNCEESMN